MNGAIPPLPQYAFMELCLVKHRDDFILLYFNTNGRHCGKYLLKRHENTITERETKWHMKRSGKQMNDCFIIALRTKVAQTTPRLAAAITVFKNVLLTSRELKFSYVLCANFIKPWFIEIFELKFMKHWRWNSSKLLGRKFDT
jgi:hypothetical protein